jgi:hypothetical protein
MTIAACYVASEGIVFGSDSTTTVFVPYCGGPIEIAVISTDRRFRWVRHKNFGAALC